MFKNAARNFSLVPGSVPSVERAISASVIADVAPPSVLPGRAGHLESQCSIKLESHLLPPLRLLSCALNWRTLGEPDKKSAMGWFYFSLAMLGVYVLMGVFMQKPEEADGAARGVGFLYLIVWYFSVGRAQSEIRQR